MATYARFQEIGVASDLITRITLSPGFEMTIHNNDVHLRR